MVRNFYDQASRYAAKLDPPGLLRWLLGRLDATIHFVRWIDTRTLPFPGEPDRTCDTVAGLVEDGPPRRWWALPIEFQTRPERQMFGRLLEYLGRVWRELRPPEAVDEVYHIAAVVVNLTGTGATSQDMQLRGTALRTCLQVGERNLASEDAAATLEDIAQGSIARCVLPWIPLMRNGGESGIIKRWKELAQTEAEPRLRGDYGGLALVFAELAGCLPAWKQALEGWNVEQSQQVLEWINKGELRSRREDLRLLLEDRFGALPEDLKLRIEAMEDLGQLQATFRQALRLQRLEDLHL